MFNEFRDLRILKQVFEFQPISNVALVCDNNSLTHMMTIKTLVSPRDVRFLHCKVGQKVSYCPLVSPMCTSSDIES